MAAVIELVLYMSVYLCDSNLIFVPYFGMRGIYSHTSEEKRFKRDGFQKHFTMHMS